MSLKQRETRIRKCAETIEKCGLEIGQELVEIETVKNKEGKYDWQETDYGSFDSYLQGEAERLTGKGYQRCRQLMRAAAAKKVAINVYSNFSATHYDELSRVCGQESKSHGLRTTFTKKDAELMDKAVSRAKEIAKEKPDKGRQRRGEVSMRDIREAVHEIKDARQGVNREQRSARDSELDLSSRKAIYLRDLSSAVGASHKLKRLISESNVSLVRLKKTREALENIYADVMEAIELASVHHPELMDEEAV